MAMKVLNWFALVSVISISLFGFGNYLTCLLFVFSFLVGIMTVLYFNYDNKKIFSVDLDSLDDPLQQTNFSIQILKVLDMFKDEKLPPKFDQRITGSETVDAFLNEIISIIIDDYINPWYEVVSSDEEFTSHSVRRLVLAVSANLANRIKSVDWIHLLSTRFPEELTTHLKLFKHAHVRLKHIHLLDARHVSNGASKVSPNKHDDKKQSHRRNKSETDLGWYTDTVIHGKSKFYSSSENLSGKSLKDLFFGIECSMENKQICRDIYCLDPDRECVLLSEVSEAVLFLIAPEEIWKCHSSKLILVELLSNVILKPIINLLSDPDNINRVIIRTCCRDIGLPSEFFLLVIRCSEDAEELDATLELVQKEIQKLHSKDSVGECELPVRQQLSSLQYLTRIINTRRAALGPQEGLFSSQDEQDCDSQVRLPDEVKRSLEFLRSSSAWRSNAQYLLEIELNESDSTQTSKAVIENLRSSALELCDMFLAPKKPTILGLPENCYVDIVRKINTDNDEFTNNPVNCFDHVQKFIVDAIEDFWQPGELCEETECTDRPLIKNENHDVRKYGGDILPSPGLNSKHNRSRSDVGNLSQKLLVDVSGRSNLSSSTNISYSHSMLSSTSRNYSPLSASIIETALVQDKGKTFGIYAIAVTKLSDKEVWHIYRRYSDFYELHNSIKEKWPELAHLPFPAKKAFQNTSRLVLERRKVMLNSYLQSLATLAREPRYTALLSDDYLGGFLSPENQAERHSNTIDAVFVNSLRAGMRTLKNMPDQFANTVDGVMDGISKVFQGKSGETESSMFSSPLEAQDEGNNSIALRLLEEILGIRGLWLRRRLLAPLRTLLADRVNKKVLEFVSSVTSPRNMVQYLKYFKQWLTNRNSSNYGVRDQATRARTRVAAKVALLAACSDDLRHIVGSDSTRRGLLTVFDLFQTQEINRRLIFVLLEATLSNLFPDNNMQELFRKLYANSPRVQTLKKPVNVN